MYMYVYVCIVVYKISVAVCLCGSSSPLCYYLGGSRGFNLFSTEAS